jgi:hypothetical protein
MTRIHFLTALAASLSLLTISGAAVYAAGQKTRQPTDSADLDCDCSKMAAGPERLACESRITTADGEDGKNNTGPNSGNGGKGGTIKGAKACPGDTVSANGGKGGSNNRGANSGNGGKGGKIEF